VNDHPSHWIQGELTFKISKISHQVGDILPTSHWYLCYYIPINGCTNYAYSAHSQLVKGLYPKVPITIMVPTYKYPDYDVLFIWVNQNISLTWIKAIWGWFPLWTMVPVREHSEVVIIYPDVKSIDYRAYIPTMVYIPNTWVYLWWNNT
jgi:hypothetical protein